MLLYSAVKCATRHGTEEKLPEIGTSATIAHMDTLALTPDWDLDTDARGNWRTVGNATPQRDDTGPGMRLAQDVASRCRSWRGEVYYDVLQGIRFEQIMGQAPNLSLLQNAFSTEALKVPLCETALADFTFAAGGARVLSGTLTVADTDGNPGVVNLL